MRFWRVKSVRSFMCYGYLRGPNGKDRWLLYLEVQETVGNWLYVGL